MNRTAILLASCLLALSLSSRNAHAADRLFKGEISDSQCCPVISIGRLTTARLAR